MFNIRLDQVLRISSFIIFCSLASFGCGGGLLYEPDHEDTPQVCVDASYCKNGGKCYIDQDGGQACDCTNVTNYEGPQCDVPREKSLSCEENNPCSEHGTCEKNGDSLSCKCDPGYGGEKCNQRRVCEQDSDCENGGTCQINDDGSSSCQCAPGYGGEKCDQRRVCEQDSDCENGGTCQINDNGGSSCQCAAGYGGEKCDKRRVCEQDSDCENGGTCQINDDGSSSCQCAAGYGGEKCESTKCGENTCKNDGKCSDSNGKIQCSCKPYFKGDFCEIERKPFKLKVKVPKEGAQIYINATANKANAGETIHDLEYDYKLDCGNGTPVTFNTGSKACNYKPAENETYYTISITGLFPHSRFCSVPNGKSRQSYAEYIYSVESWGEIEWLSTYAMFALCPNFYGVGNTIPNLSKTDKMGEMFKDVVSPGNDGNLEGNLNQWDVSNVNDMRYMFEGFQKFNKDITSWNVSKVQTMKGMFNNTSFNQDISEWKVGNVTDMQNLFSYTPFNYDIADWNIAKLENVKHMFYSAYDFNQDLSKWSTKTDSVTKCFEFSKLANSWDPDYIPTFSSKCLTSVDN